MVYADVILPLPLAGTFTYRLPEALATKVRVGCRVIVPFGSKKIYSGVVGRVHDVCPADCEVKDVLEVLDECPVLLPEQLKLWSWIAEYYLCSIGEVYKAALPSGMKLESESRVVLCDDFVAPHALSANEQAIMDALEMKPEQRVADLQKVSQLKNVLPVVKRLLEMGAIMMKEEVRRTYKPKTKACVRIPESIFDEARLHALLDELHRSQKQLALFYKYLELAKISSALVLGNYKLLAEVDKQDLLQQSDTTPAILRALVAKGILEVYQKPLSRLGAVELPQQVELHSLSPAQQRAYDEIQQVFATRNVCLLHGVTSSGKTEVYIHLIQKALDEGKQVLYLLPEIVLTTQLVERLKRVFGARLGVYHSKYPDAERVEIWQKQLSAEPYDIIVGVRSSVLLPFRRLGLVIVDEEHETSFKQEDPAPRYHARNVALVLAAQSGAKSLLGTATPSLETYYNASMGKYGRVELMERYRQIEMPEIEVVDMNEQHRKKLLTGPFSDPLLVEMRRALADGEQVILFQNRRGYAPTMECNTCGWTPRCQMCDVSLTHHRSMRLLTCHYCGHTYPLPAKCPNCEGTQIRNHGYGTERIEDELKQLFPEARVGRMDLDTTRTRQAYEGILDDFQHGRTDILVGTQMVTKGLDFERVSVVGILNADTMLNMPDFRSYERAFQMMSQVAGRAGRHGRRGKVFLQTRNAELPVVAQVVANDYKGLYAEQIDERQLFRYPPFSHLVYVYMKHRDARTIEAMAADMATLMRRVFGDRVLGPDEPPVGRVQMLYIRKIVLKVEAGASLADMRSRLRQIQQHIQAQSAYKSAQIYYDVDPY